jgi:hypothetical protein
MAIAPFALQGHAAPMGGPTGRQAFGIPMGSCYTDSSDSTTGAGGVGTDSPQELDTLGKRNGRVKQKNG